MNNARYGQQKERSNERLWIVLALFCLGAFVAWHATGYDLGSLRRMGPGYFPLMLGIVLCVLAAMVFAAPDVQDDGLQDGNAATAPMTTLATRLRAFGFVLAAMIVFALLIRRTGFVPATALATIIAGLAEPDNGWRDLVILSAAVTLFASLVFVVMLGVPVRLVAF